MDTELFESFEPHKSWKPNERVFFPVDGRVFDIQNSQESLNQKFGALFSDQVVVYDTDQAHMFLKNAEYGADGHQWVDVSYAVWHFFNDNFTVLSIPPGSMFNDCLGAGDPVPGIAKTLKITLEIYLSSNDFGLEQKNAKENKGDPEVRHGNVCHCLGQVEKEFLEHSITGEEGHLVEEIKLSEIASGIFQKQQNEAVQRLSDVSIHPVDWFPYCVLSHQLFSIGQSISTFILTCLESCDLHKSICILDADSVMPVIKRSSGNSNMPQLLDKLQKSECKYESDQIMYIVVNTSSSKPPTRVETINEQEFRYQRAPYGNKMISSRLEAMFPAHLIYATTNQCTHDMWCVLLLFVCSRLATSLITVQNSIMGAYVFAKRRKCIDYYFVSEFCQ